MKELEFSTTDPYYRTIRLQEALKKAIRKINKLQTQVNILHSLNESSSKQGLAEPITSTVNDESEISTQQKFGDVR